MTGRRHSDLTRAKMSEASRKALADPAVRAKMKGARSNVDVPRWVPTDLVDDYIDYAILYGEEDAASRVRALKRTTNAAR